MQQNSFMMNEMMEMKAQLQMYHMGQMPMVPGQGMPMPGLPMPGTMRPMSAAGNSRMSIAPSNYGRTMSFMGTPQYPQPGAPSVRTMSMAGQGMQHANLNYAASVAPSERSNIGQPTRYKPVNFADGGSTITSGSTPRLSTMLPVDPQSKKKGFLNAVMHSGKKSSSKPTMDDDEEEAWAAPRRKR